jgi:imidazolonepropionase
MQVLRNIGLLAACAPAGGQAATHEVPEAALAWEDGKIVWVGPERDLPRAWLEAESLDAGGRLVIPGLIDCHTHLGFAGWRAQEFEARLRGVDYEEALRNGGGILTTVAATRAASDGELFARAAGCLDEMVALGVTTVECKSGYGLDFATELRLLRLYRRLARERPTRIVTTVLGAHAVPPEFAHDRAAYVALVTRELLPAAAREGLADCCDVFLERSAFTAAEARDVLETARSLGLGRKVHADQLSSGGGAELAAEVGALSADHLECVSERGIRALSEAGVVAVSLPLASLYLNRPPMPARRLIEAGVPVAVATDFNPGSAPSYHLPLAMLLACLMQRMSPAEVLKGATLYSARALGIEARCGSLEVGKAADFAVIDAPDVTNWLYHFRANACRATVIGGAVCRGGLTPSPRARAAVRA